MVYQPESRIIRTPEEAGVLHAIENRQKPGAALMPDIEKTAFSPQVRVERFTSERAS